MSSLNKRIILVTGANTGIGYELVKLLALKPEGHTVYLGSRDEAKGKKAVDELKKTPGVKGEIKFVQLDVTDAKSVESARDVIKQAEGRLDTLVNNAGIANMQIPQTASNVQTSTIASCIDANLYGIIHTTQLFAPLLLVSHSTHPGYATILNVSTDMASNSLMASFKAPDFLYGVVAYNTSKAAANTYTIAAAHEWKGKIKVNAVTPGFTTTALNGYTPGGKTPEQGAEELVPWCLLEPKDEHKTGLFYAGTQRMDW